MEKIYSGDRAKEIKEILDTAQNSTANSQHPPLHDTIHKRSYDGNPVKVEVRAYTVDIPNGKMERLLSGLDYSTEPVIDSSSSNGVINLVGSKRAIKFLERRAKIRR